MIRIGYSAAEARKENIIGRRIREARQALACSQGELKARLARMGVDVTVAAISKWEVGGSIPNGYQLLALCRALEIPEGLEYFSGPRRDAELNETGLRKLREYRADLIASGRYRVARPAEPIRYIEMPVSMLSASAGTGAFLDEGSFERIPFPEGSIPAGAEFGVRVRGDSMEPVYRDGQIVWVQRCSRLRPGEVGVFLYDGEGYLKVYGEQPPEDPERFTDSGGAVRMQPVLLSYNEAYAPKVVSPDCVFAIAGRVLN